MLLLTSIPPITGPILSPLMAPITVLLPQWMLIILFAIIPFYMWLSYWPGRKAKVVPIRASAFSPDKVPSNLDTIVIGSGSGGSSCSNILAQSGQKVLLLEQHEERTGGCTHTFRINGCEWDTGLHYTSEGMGLPTHRAGALLKFMSRGKQEWKRLDDPYDQVIFPPDQNVSPGRPNYNEYDFNTDHSLGKKLSREILDRIDPGNEFLLKQCE
eukprot:scaffold1291_cov98-Skeletonema_dohrnii-CCMP3373.AAC.1